MFYVRIYTEKSSLWTHAKIKTMVDIPDLAHEHFGALHTERVKITKKKLNRYRETLAIHAVVI